MSHKFVIRPANHVRVLGCDPSFTKFGWVIADINLTDFTVIPVASGCFRTSKSKTKGLVSADHVRRIHSIHRPLSALAGSVDMVISEVPSGGAQSHSAAVALAYALCMVACIDKPLVQLTPSAVKKAAIGHTTASKDEMMEWGRALHPEIQWTNTKVQDEHIADALAAIYAGIETSDFLELSTGIMGE